MMRRGLETVLKQSLADERGQATTEYILLVVVVVIAAFGAFNLFAKGIVGYYQRITMVVSLPIP
jgi:Flp pilus assembly pilin Flp